MNVRRLVLAVAVASVCIPGVALAQDTTPGEHLGGYVGRASAMAFSFQPVFPALLPTGDAPFEATIALATARALGSSPYSCMIRARSASL